MRWQKTISFKGYVFSDLNFNVNTENFWFLGPSGSGKTTTLKVI